MLLLQDETYQKQNNMSKIAENLTELIGRTPMMRLSAYMKTNSLQADIVAKIESFNPSGSVKARAALAMIEDAERRGLLAPGATIIEPTSGNTGIGLAMVATIKGYRLILTMPDTMSEERHTLLKAYGAELVLTPGSEGMAGSIRKAYELLESMPGAFMPQQFSNIANPAIHEKTTAEEIWETMQGDIAAFVAGVGTGGTLSGIGRRLKQHNAEIRIVAVEPSASQVLQGREAGAHKLQGIGANFIPENYDASVVDEVIAVSDDEAYTAVRSLACTEALLAGISSGAALHVATLLAQRPEYAGRRIVVLLPDSGERYLSTGVFG